MQPRQWPLLLLLWTMPGSAVAAGPGAVIAWGDNNLGQARVPAAAQSGVTAVAAGYGHSLALKADGSVVAWGDNRQGQTNLPVGALSGVRAVSAGSGHSVALKEDGSVVAWGADDYGQAIVPAEAQSGVKAIAAGGVHTVALKNDGSVVAWGDNMQGQTTVPAEAQSGVTAIAAGYGHTVVLKADGSVVAWGYNSHGQTTVPVAARSGVVAIAAGYRHTMALKSDGSVVAWGDDTYGHSWVPAVAKSGVKAVAAGYRHSVVLKENGSVVAWGDNSQKQTAVPFALGPATAVAAGSAHTLALVPLTPPSIIWPPVSQSVVIGETAYFSVTASGYPLYYQWRFNGESIPGATLPSLTLPGVSLYHRGDYSVVITNSLGTVSSDAAKLSVIYYAPTGEVYLASGSLPAPAGSTVMLCSSISAAPVATYQWQFNGQDLPGQTNPCLDLRNITTNRVGSYSLAASNLVGVFTTTPIFVEVNQYAPRGSIYPSGTLPPVLAGGTVSICSSIEAAPPPTFQWQFNGADIPGQIEPCLRLYNAQTNQSGAYRLIARNVYGSLTSDVAIVTVVYASPTARISLGSGRIPTMVSNSLSLCALVSGAPVPTLQWQRNGVNLPGQTDSCLSFSEVQMNDSGDYTVVASNIFGVVTSAVAVVTVVESAPVLACFATGLPPLMVGSYHYLYAEVALPEPMALQWRLDGINLLDATNYWLSLYPVEAAHAGDYSVVATTVSGSYTSPPLALTVYYEPPSGAVPSFILGSSSALVGSDVSLVANYYGSPCTIQWLFNNVSLPGQTNHGLALLSITTNQVGQYSFTASNSAGMTTSAVARLNVRYQAPQFAANPSSQSVVEGSAVRFRAYAPGGPPPVYHLLHDGTDVAVPLTFEGYGPDSGGFSLLDTTLADAGNYWIIASNFLGSATSAVATLTVSIAGPLDRWSQRNPLPQSYRLLAVAHGTNQCVAVGERGTILTSGDGSSWAVQSRRADVPLNGIAYGAGLFVAVGEGGTILSSPDGTNWAYRSTAASTLLNSVTYADGRFVVVGSTPGFETLVMHSSDGVHWERVPLYGMSGERCVAYGNGLFVAGGFLSILASRDATNWTLVQNVARAVEDITYAAGQYVAVGDDGSMLVSPDGASWMPRLALTDRRLLGVTYGAGRFIAVGARGNILTSTDGDTWTAIPSGTPDRLETVDFTGEQFIAVGENGTIITSANGTNWAKQNFGTTRDLDGMAVANGLLMVVGKAGTVLTTTNGAHYTQQETGTTNDLHGVAWGGGVWVAVGEPGTILCSSNAVDWLSYDTGITNSLKGVTYAGGRWLAVGTEGAVVRSTNAMNWEASFVSPPFDLNDIAYGDGVFLIAGDGPGGQNGSVFESRDGVAWGRLQYSPGKNLRGVTFANGVFLLPANDGIVFAYHNDGIAGTLGIFASLNTRNLRALTWAGGLWIVAGNDGAIFTSTNGVVWTRRVCRTFENLHEIAYLDGTLVAIGNRGTVLQSRTFLTEFDSPRLVDGVGFQLPFKGVFNHVYQLQATSDLVNWTPVATFTNVAEHAVFTDPDALQSERRFYRLAEP